MLKSLKFLATGTMCLLAAACGEREQPSFEEQFNSTRSEIENRAVVLEREAENGIAAQAEALEAEANALRLPMDLANNMASADPPIE